MLYIGEGIVNAIIGWILSLFFWIDSRLAFLISFVYDFMIYVAGAKFFAVEYVRRITTSLYTLIGIFILFYVAVELIKTIMNPDNLLSGEGSLGKISSRIFITLVLIGSVPWVFNIALPQVQQILIGTAGYSENSLEGSPGIIQSLLSEESIADTRPGLSIAGAMLTAFVTTESDIQNDIELEEDCTTLLTDVGTGTNSATNFVESADKLNICIKKGDLSYIPILPTACLAIAVILMVSFLFDVVKVICELWFLEIISPIPIMTYILPQHAIFDNWLKAIKNAFIKLIMRIASISLLIVAMNVVKQILAEFVAIDDFISIAGIMQLLLNVVLIIGLIMFAKDLPNTLSTIFGIDMGGGLNGVGKKLFGYGAKGLGAIGGGFAGGRAAKRAARHAGLTRKERREAAREGRKIGRSEGWNNSSIEGINTKDGTKLAADVYGGSVSEQRKAEKVATAKAKSAKAMYEKNTRIAGSVLKRSPGGKVTINPSGMKNHIKSDSLRDAAREYIKNKGMTGVMEERLKTARQSGNLDAIELAKEKLEQYRYAEEKAKTALSKEIERTKNKKDRSVAQVVLDGSYDKNKIN